MAHLLGGFSSTRGTGYLSIFPGKYVVLAYGMNDAASVSNGRDYYNNLRAMVRAVIARGKIPVIPTISYTNNAAYNRQIPILNAKVGQLYKAYPQIVKGPDFWTYFRQHPDLIGAGDIHPTSLGYAAMRQLWARTMLTEVYQERSG
ncbi:MAG: SGNH/GDSL hydrolase family protein [Chloroflexi bacterium]|nr:SGNH/GDSL hydrolase family protein [Chloroflexota bacterium]